MIPQEKIEQLEAQIKKEGHEYRMMEQSLERRITDLIKQNNVLYRENRNLKLANDELWKQVKPELDAIAQQANEVLDYVEGEDDNGQND